jgi:hypothetical protein
VPLQVYNRRHALLSPRLERAHQHEEWREEGYTINEEGVTLSTDKMAAIRDSRPPSNLKQIREFVGLANYCRFLIKDFSKMLAPMTALTKKDSGWKGGKLPKKHT